MFIFSSILAMERSKFPILCAFSPVFLSSFWSRRSSVESICSRVGSVANFLSNSRASCLSDVISGVGSSIPSISMPLLILLALSRVSSLDFLEADRVLARALELGSGFFGPFLIGVRVFLALRFLDRFVGFALLFSSSFSFVVFSPFFFCFVYIFTSSAHFHLLASFPCLHPSCQQSFFLVLAADLRTIFWDHSGRPRGVGGPSDPPIFTSVFFLLFSLQVDHFL